MKAEKRTSERILDVAEELFAAKGYDAASLGDIADLVGVRSPAIYKHYRNKKALFEAVLARLFDPFCAMLIETIRSMEPGEISNHSVRVVRVILKYLAEHPNLARLIQHANLVGGEFIELLIKNWYQPLFEQTIELFDKSEITPMLSTGAVPHILMSFNNLMLGYITLAPLHKQVLHVDPFDDETIEKQVELIQLFIKGLLEASTIQQQASTTQT